MALLLLLIIPLLLAGLIYLVVTGFNTLRDKRLENYVDNDVESTEAIGDEWKMPAVERPDHGLETVSYFDAEKAFKSFVADEEQSMKPEPDVDDQYWGDTPEKVRAYNRARVRMAEWLMDKTVRHHTGLQRCDFLAMNPEKEIPLPRRNDRKNLEAFMKDTGLAWSDVYNVVWKQAQIATPGFTQHEDLVRSSLAQQIRDNERKRCTDEFLTQLKDIQKKVEDEQFALNLEKKLLTERVASLIEEVKKKDAELEAMKVPACSVKEIPNEVLERITNQDSLVSEIVKKREFQRKSTPKAKRVPAKKTKRKN